MQSPMPGARVGDSRQMRFCGFLSYCERIIMIQMVTIRRVLILPSDWETRERHSMRWVLHDPVRSLGPAHGRCSATPWLCVHTKIECGFQPQVIWLAVPDQSWPLPDVLFYRDSEESLLFFPNDGIWPLVNLDLRALMTELWFSSLGIGQLQPLFSLLLPLGKGRVKDKANRMWYL